MKANYLRTKRKRTWGAEPGLQPEYVPPTEADENRKRVRDWLRDRDETNVVDFEREDGDELFDWAVGNGWE